MEERKAADGLGPPVGRTERKEMALGNWALASRPRKEGKGERLVGPARAEKEEVGRKGNKLFYFSFINFSNTFAIDFEILFEFGQRPVITKETMQQHECTSMFLSL